MAPDAGLRLIGLQIWGIYSLSLTMVVGLLLALPSQRFAEVRRCRLRGWFTACFTKKKLHPGRSDLPFSLRLRSKNYPSRTLRQQLISAEINLRESFPFKKERTQRLAILAASY